MKGFFLIAETDTVESLFCYKNRKSSSISNLFGIIGIFMNRSYNNIILKKKNKILHHKCVFFSS